MASRVNLLKPINLGFVALDPADGKTLYSLIWFDCALGEAVERYVSLFRTFTLIESRFAIVPADSVRGFEDEKRLSHFKVLA